MNWRDREAFIWMRMEHRLETASLALREKGSRGAMGGDEERREKSCHYLLREHRSRGRMSNVNIT